MGVPINYMAVLLAAVASMVLGFLWYGPLFGKQWIKLSGFTKDQMTKAQKKGMEKSYAMMFGGSLLMAYVMAHAYTFASSYLHMTGLSAGLMGGFWNWLGFVMPVTLSSVLWDGKPWKLWVINTSYYLVTLMVMGVIISLL